MRATGWVREFDLSGEGRAAKDVGTGHGRGSIEIAQGAGWVANAWGRTLARLELPNLDVTAVMKLGKVPVGIASGAGALWVLSRNGWVWRVWPTEPRVEGLARAGQKARSIGADERYVWILRDGGELVQVEPISGELLRQVSVGGGGWRILADRDALWVLAGRGRRLLRLDPSTGRIETETKLPGRAVGMAPHTGTLWVAYGYPWRQRGEKGAGALVAVDSETGALGVSHVLSNHPGAMTSGNGAVWIACGPLGVGKDGTIERFDTRSASLETVVWSTRWPVDSLAVRGESLLAAMSIGGSVHGGGSEHVGIADRDMGGGGDGGDGGGGGG